MEIRIYNYYLIELTPYAKNGFGILQSSYKAQILIIKKMIKLKSIITLSTLVTFIFSCSDSTSKPQQQETTIETPTVDSSAIETRPDIIIEYKKEIKNDTTPVVGILKAVHESDFWGRVYLSIDVDGMSNIFNYYDIVGDGNFKNVENLIGEKVVIKFIIEETIEEIDLHVANKTIYGEYGRIKTEEQVKGNSESKIEGTLMVHEYDKTGDLPGNYRIIDNNGDTIIISGFVYNDHVALNGKKATVYYALKTTYIAKSIVSLEKAESNTNSIIIGKWNKEDSSNPIDPASFEINRENENSYYIKFSNEHYFVELNDTLNILKGKSNSGNFSIKLVSKNPAVILYSDDGRGHFEPVVNERFIKVQ